MGNFDESLHPRDSNGKFGDGGGSSAALRGGMQHADLGHRERVHAARTAALRSDKGAPTHTAKSAPAKVVSKTGAGSKVPLRGNMRASNLSFQQRIHAARTAMLRSK